MSEPMPERICAYLDGKGRVRLAVGAAGIHETQYIRADLARAQIRRETAEEILKVLRADHETLVRNRGARDAKAGGVFRAEFLVAEWIAKQEAGDA